MKVHLSETTVEDYQSFFKAKPEKVESIDIQLSKVNFAQENGFNLLIQKLSIYGNTKQISLRLKEQQITTEEIGSLSKIIVQFKKLLVVQLKIQEKVLSADEFQVLFNSISINSTIVIVEIASAKQELDSEQCQAIANFLIKQKSLNKLKFEMGTNGQLFYGVVGFGNQEKDISMELSNISLKTKNEFTTLITPLISYKRLGQLKFQQYGLKIEDAEVNLNTLLSFFNEIELLQLQEAQQPKSNEQNEKKQEIFKYFENFELNSDGQIYIIKQNSQTFQIEIKNQFVFSGLNLSPLTQFQNIENLVFKLFAGKFSIQKDQVEEITKVLSKVRSFELELDQESNEIKNFIEKVSQLDNLDKIKLNLKLQQQDNSKFNIFFAFIEDVAKNQNIKEIFINFFQIQYTIDFKKFAQKLKEMKSFQKITIEYEQKQEVEKSLAPKNQTVKSEYTIKQLLEEESQP